MEVRGSITDRPWGLTLGAISLRRHTGQLAIESDGKRYCVAFDDGAIVAASSPLAADAIARIALTNHLITSTQVADITRRLAAAPDRDEVDVLADAVRFSPAQVLRLRLRLVAQRAARTFSIEHGDFVLDDRIALPVFAGVAIDHRHVIYLGVRNNLSEQRLLDDLRQLGSYFVLKPEAIEELSRFEFEPSAQPVLDALRTGTSLPELEAAHRELDPRFAQAIIYSLVSCSACMMPPRTATLAASLARAASTDEAGTPRTSTRPTNPVAIRKQTGQAAPQEAGASRKATGQTAPLETGASRKATGQTAPQETGASRKATGQAAPLEAGASRKATGQPPPQGAGASRKATGQPPPQDAGASRKATGQAAPLDPGPPPGGDWLPVASAPADPVPPVPAPPERVMPTSLLVAPTSTATRPPFAAGTDAYPRTPEASRTATQPGSPPPRPGAPPPVSGPRTTTTSSPFATRTRTASPSAYASPTARDAGTNTPAATRTKSQSEPPATTPRAATQPGPGPVLGRSQTPVPPATPRTATSPAAPRESRAMAPLQVPTAPPEDPATLLTTARSDTEENVRFTETPTPLPASAKQSAVTFGDPQPTRAGSGTLSAPRPVPPRTPTGDADAMRGFADQRTPGFSDQRTPGFSDQRTPVSQRTPTDPGYARTPTGSPVSSRVSTDIAVAAEAAFKRGELAMKRDQPGEAILEYKAALDLNPHDVDYAGMLAWAKFCAAGDKPGIGAETRKILERAVFKSQRPERARFYLGRVERMLGRDKEALRHFMEVLDIKPNHAEAASEIRAIEARLQAASKGGTGIFGRKR